MADDPIVETAKAVQEGAKASTKALELAEKAGPFLGRMFGPLIENAVGIVSDRLGYYRLVNFYGLAEKVESIHRERGVTNPRRVAPKFALPLIEAATIEEHDELHDLWARLLANAMDPGYEYEVNRSFVTVLQDFTPMEALLMSELYRQQELHGRNVDIRRYKFRRAVGEDYPKNVPGTGNLIENVSIGQKETVAWMNLRRLGCIDTVENNGWISAVRLTAFGLALAHACGM